MSLNESDYADIPTSRSLSRAELKYIDDVIMSRERRAALVAVEQVIKLLESKKRAAQSQWIDLPYSDAITEVISYRASRIEAHMESTP